MFYNPKRRHNTSGGVSPVEFEKRQSQRLGSVYRFRVDSICAVGRASMGGKYRA
jgi:hypothetical protein